MTHHEKNSVFAPRLQPTREPRTSWWLDAPREGFTAAASKHTEVYRGSSHGRMDTGGIDSARDWTPGN